MGEQTNISWCDKTFNPWIGCTKVSNGDKGACVNCYAEDWADSRFHRVAWGGPGQGVGTRVRTSEATWRQPLAWDRKAAKEGTRPFVFCSILADVFDNQVDPQWRRDLFDLIRQTPHLTWLLLTKRPQNIVKLFDGDVQQHHQEKLRLDLGLWWPRNAAIGCTVVTQEEADRDIPILLAAKAELKPAFAFVSMEPLMGAVDLTSLVTDPDDHMTWNALTAEWSGHREPWFDAALDWVITGGESGPNARPSHPDWFRSLRDQCAGAGVPFHFKQHGEWIGGDQIPEDQAIPSGISNDCGIEGADDNRRVWRVGKKAAGRLLDGALHDARPSLA